MAGAFSVDQHEAEIGIIECSGDGKVDDLKCFAFAEDALAPRIGEGDPTSTQRKLASALHMQQASHAASAPSDETSRMVAAQQNERPGNAANYPTEDDERLPEIGRESCR